MLHRSTRRDAQMRCDATRIPQLTTATTTSKHTFTQKRRQEVVGKEEEGEEEKEVVEEAQQTFLFKRLSTKMTKFWAARKASRKRKAIEVRLKRKSTRSGERKRERASTTKERREEKQTRERWREGRGKRSRQWSARGEWTLRQVVAGCVGMKVMQRNTHKHTERLTHTDRQTRSHGERSFGFRRCRLSARNKLTVFLQPRRLWLVAVYVSGQLSVCVCECVRESLTLHKCANLWNAVAFNATKRTVISER